MGWAESGSAPAAQPQAQQGRQPANPNVLDAFTPGFFDKVGPANENPNWNGPKVTADVLKTFKAECESEKAKGGMSAFSRCVAGKEDNAVKLREQKIDETNRINNLPIQNAKPQLIKEEETNSIQEND